MSVPTVLTVTYGGVTRTFQTTQVFQKTIHLLDAVSENMGWNKNLACYDVCLFGRPNSDHITALKPEEGGRESLVTIYADGNLAKLEALDRFWEEFRPAEDIVQSYPVVLRLLEKKCEPPSLRAVQWTRELLIEMNSQLEMLKERNKQLEEKLGAMEGKE